MHVQGHKNGDLKKCNAKKFKKNAEKQAKMQSKICLGFWGKKMSYISDEREKAMHRTMPTQIFASSEAKRILVKNEVFCCQFRNRYFFRKTFYNLWLALEISHENFNDNFQDDFLPNPACPSPPFFYFLLLVEI